MKRFGTFLMAVFLLISTLSICGSAGSDRLVDDADLLTVAQESALRAELDRISEAYRVDVVVVTTDSTYGSSPMVYADDYYDYHDYVDDGVLLMISMEYRDWWISTTGEAIGMFSDDTIESIGEWMQSDLSSGDYAAAFETFVEECEYYINGYLNGFPYDVTANLLTAVIVGLIVAFIVTMIMRAQLKSVRTQSAASNYIKQGSFQVTMANEIYLYRHVSRVRKSSDSSSSTHSSSSGSSHGGGGGKF